MTIKPGLTDKNAGKHTYKNIIIVGHLAIEINKVKPILRDDKYLSKVNQIYQLYCKRLIISK